MARDRQRAKQRRRRQPGTGRPGRARRDRDAARDIGLDDADVDEAGLGEARRRAPDHRLDTSPLDVDRGVRLADEAGWPTPGAR